MWPVFALQRSIILNSRHGDARFISIIHVSLPHLRIAGKPQAARIWRAQLACFDVNVSGCGFFTCSRAEDNARIFPERDRPSVLNQEGKGPVPIKASHPGDPHFCNQYHDYSCCSALDRWCSSFVQHRADF